MIIVAEVCSGESIVTEVIEIFAVVFTANTLHSVIIPLHFLVVDEF